MNTIEQAREVSARLHLGAFIANSRGIDKDFAILAAEAGTIIDALIAELAALKRTEIIDLLQTNSEMQAELAALKQQEPVLCVDKRELATLKAGDAAIKAWLPPALGENELPLYLAAGAQPVPAGYQLVPIEPTEAMCLAGQDHPGCISVYKAMLAAAKDQP